MIALSPDQIAKFAGNAMELRGTIGRLLALSSTAHAALTPGQITLIRESCPLVPLDIPTIERAGGSVRCTLPDFICRRAAEFEKPPWPALPGVPSGCSGHGVDCP